jgi:hypothetical protein
MHGVQDCYQANNTDLDLVEDTKTNATDKKKWTE